MILHYAHWFNGNGFEINGTYITSCNEDVYDLLKEIDIKNITYIYYASSLSRVRSTTLKNFFNGLIFNRNIHLIEICSLKLLKKYYDNVVYVAKNAINILEDEKIIRIDSIPNGCIVDGIEHENTIREKKIYLLVDFVKNMIYEK